MIIDTHIHLNDEAYINDLDEVIKNAKEADVGKMIVVGYDYESSLKAINLAHTYNCLYAAVGLHPSEVKKNSNIDWLVDLAKDSKVVAIGEIGLDYYWDDSFKDLQQEIFLKQIQISKRLNLPIIVHSRNALEDTYKILKKDPTKGVMHCYSYDLDYAKKFVSLGYYLGIGGVVTFKKAQGLKDVVREIDINYLLSETDAPYLAPSPFRGKLNKPEYLKYIIEEMSLLKGIDSKILKEALAKNASRLFNL